MDGPGLGWADVAIASLGVERAGQLLRRGNIKSGKE